jgi:hypothetical protein
MAFAAGMLILTLVGCASNNSASSSGSVDSAENSVSATPNVEASQSSEALSSESGSGEGASSDNGASGSSSLFTGQEWPENETTAAVPKPVFSQPIESLNVSNHIVDARWDGVEESEVVAYIEQLKSAGFTVDVIENKSSTSYSYSARNQEDYQGSSSVWLSYYAAQSSSPTSLNISVSIL